MSEISSGAQPRQALEVGGGMFGRKAGLVRAVAGVVSRSGVARRWARGRIGLRQTTRAAACSSSSDPPAGEIIFEGRDLTRLDATRCGRCGGNCSDLPGPVQLAQPPHDDRRDRRRAARRARDRPGAVARPTACSSCSGTSVCCPSTRRAIRTSSRAPAPARRRGAGAGHGAGSSLRRAGLRSTCRSRRRSSTPR